MIQKASAGYTLDLSIKSGQSKIEGKIIRCANKGITEIGKVSQCSLIEKLFISTNLISSLKGIEQFKNLRVLSISYNDIRLISEIKYLRGLALDTINMEGNPITQLPFYQHHVFYTIPTLKFIDGKAVSEKLRSNAQNTVDYDTEHLKKMCANDIHILELEDLINFPGERSQQWSNLAQKALIIKKFESYDLSNKEQEERFDRLREEALEIRMKDKTASLNKWNLVYESIESEQEKVIKDLTIALQNYLSQINSKTIIKPEKKNLASKSNNISSKSINSTKKNLKNSKTNAKLDVSPISILNNQISKKNGNYLSQDINITANSKIPPLSEEDSKSLYEIHDNCLSKMNDESSSNNSILESIMNTMTLSPMPHSIIPQPVQYKNSPATNIDDIIFNYYKLSKLKKVFKQWENQYKRYAVLNKLSHIYQNQKEMNLKSKYFQKWHRNYILVPKKNGDLQISQSISYQFPYKLLNIPQEANIKLLERAQSMAEQISKLQADLELAENKNVDVRKALEESVKNEEKMKGAVRKITKEKEDLSRRLAKSEAKYEEEVVQYMLESRFKNDQQELTLAELEKANQQKNHEILALKKFISETKSRNEIEINDLKQKLSSAFDVASGFRFEISRLKGESFLSGKTTPTKS